MKIEIYIILNTYDVGLGKYGEHTLALGNNQVLFHSRDWTDVTDSLSTQQQIARKLDTKVKKLDFTILDYINEEEMKKIINSYKNIIKEFYEKIK